MKSVGAFLSDFLMKGKYLSVLSNVELEKNLRGAAPFVKGLSSDIDRQKRFGPLEAASIRLSVGKIYQFKKNENGADLAQTRDEVILHPGEVAFVLTREEIALDNAHVGLVTPKSGGVADKGILITNTGHVDPGYRGCLRYAVINMGQEEFCLRRGDVLVKLMIQTLCSKADPDWLEIHEIIPDPTSNTIRPLGHDFLNIEERAKQIAEKTSRDMFVELTKEWGIPAIVVSVMLSTFVGVVASITAAVVSGGPP